MKKLFLFALILLITGCTGAKSTICEAGKVTAGVVAVSIGTELACSNIDAIKVTLEEKLKATNICEGKPESKSFTQKSVVGSIVCAPLIESVFAGGLAQIPKEWGCTGGEQVAGLKEKLIASCIKSI